MTTRLWYLAGSVRIDKNFSVLDGKGVEIAEGVRKIKCLAKYAGPTMCFIDYHGGKANNLQMVEVEFESEEAARAYKFPWQVQTANPLEVTSSPQFTDEALIADGFPIMPEFDAAMMELYPALHQFVGRRVRVTKQEPFRMIGAPRPPHLTANTMVVRSVDRWSATVVLTTSAGIFKFDCRAWEIQKSYGTVVLTQYDNDRPRGNGDKPIGCRYAFRIV
jgi:hypothetical protein